MLVIMTRTVTIIKFLTCSRKIVQSESQIASPMLATSLLAYRVTSEPLVQLRPREPLPPSIYLMRPKAWLAQSRAFATMALSPTSTVRHMLVHTKRVSV